MCHFVTRSVVFKHVPGARSNACYDLHAHHHAADCSRKEEKLQSGAWQTRNACSNTALVLCGVHPHAKCAGSHVGASDDRSARLNVGAPQLAQQAAWRRSWPTAAAATCWSSGDG
jgi:hypothetical protein